MQLWYEYQSTEYYADSKYPRVILFNGHYVNATNIIIQERQLIWKQNVKWTMTTG